MKKLIYISFIFAFVLAFVSCEKEIISPNGIENGVRGGDITNDRDTEDPYFTRGGEDGDLGDNITDPDEDEDFDEDGDEDDGVTDPDEDEDFDDKDGGK